MTADSRWDPLPRAEVVKALERKRPQRIPVVRARWWGEGLTGQYWDRLREFDKYPEDTVTLLANPLNVGAMGLSLKMDTLRRGHDSRRVIDDWEQLDGFIDKMPSPDADPNIGALIKQAEAERAQDELSP